MLKKIQECLAPSLSDTCSKHEKDVVADPDLFIDPLLDDISTVPFLTHRAPGPRPRHSTIKIGVVSISHEHLLLERCRL